MEAFDHTPFKEMLERMRVEELQNNLPDNEPIIGNIVENRNMIDSKWQLTIGLGLLICVCVSTGVLPDMKNMNIPDLSHILSYWRKNG